MRPIIIIRGEIPAATLEAFRRAHAAADWRPPPPAIVVSAVSLDDDDCDDGYRAAVEAARDDLIRTFEPLVRGAELRRRDEPRAGRLWLGIVARGGTILAWDTHPSKASADAWAREAKRRNLPARYYVRRLRRRGAP